MDCSTIIVSYNTFELTKAAILSVLDSARQLRHEVVVVDNNSPDDSGKLLIQHFGSSEFSNVTILKSDDNIGFAAANNIGAANSSGEVLFFLNPDTLVHDKCVTSLINFIQQTSNAGAVGPLVLNDDGSIQKSVLKFPNALDLLRLYFPITLKRRSGTFTRRVEAFRRITRVDALKGCAIALSRSAFDTIGGWNESFFMYSEEVDFCQRLADRGFKNYFLPQACITHYGGQASQERYIEHQVLERQSALSYLRRHGSKSLIAFNRIAGFSGYFLRAGVYALLIQIQPSCTEDYRRRGEAASALWRWFAFKYK